MIKQVNKNEGKNLNKTNITNKQYTIQKPKHKTKIIPPQIPTTRHFTKTESYIS